MKYYEECGDHEQIFSLPICRECEKEIKPGDKCYQHEGGTTFLCYECGQTDNPEPSKE